VKATPPSNNLVFKKAFGLETLPSDSFIWLMELQNSSFQVEPKPKSKSNLAFRIECGQVGLTKNEKTAIGLFKHSDERSHEHISAVPSLNLSTHIDIEIPNSVKEKVVGSANEIVEPYIGSAFVALQNFIEAYRDVKYLKSRNTTRWSAESGVFVRELSFRDFKTYLFYSFTVRGREFVGCFSEGTLRTFSPGDKSMARFVQQNLNATVPLPRVLIVRAWESLFDGNFRSAIVDSATVIEDCIIQILTKRLLEGGIESKTAVNDFVKETSKRLLLRIIGGLLKIESEIWRKEVVATLETRHRLVHGVQRYATKREADAAVKHAERFLSLAEELKAVPSFDVPQDI
jgi:hypothetical protein